VSLSPQASALPGRVLILGLGWSGRVLAAQLQARGVQVAGTVRDPAASPDDGLRRYPLQAGTPPAPGLLEEIARAEAVLCSVPADAEGDPALRMLLPALHASPALRWVGYLSSTSVYADRAGGWIDESSVADATEAVGVQRRLAEAQWRALASNAALPLRYCACPAFTDRVAMRCCSWRRGVHATWCALAWCSTACTCRIWPR